MSKWITLLRVIPIVWGARLRTPLLQLKVGGPGNGWGWVSDIGHQRNYQRLAVITGSHW